MTIKFDKNNIELSHSWHQISWCNVEWDVKRLRSRIFKARKDKNFKELRQLQRLMIKSYSNLLLSIRRVTQGSGKNTPGIDKEIFLSAIEKMTLAREIMNTDLKNWNPPPTKRVYIPKPDGKKRPLGIPTIKDRVIQAIFKNALEPEWESQFEKISYGFRVGRTYHDAAERIHGILSKKLEYGYLMVA